MSKTVQHKQLYRRGPWGSIINRTLCGRVASGEDMNIADSDSSVTCKLCRRWIGTTRDNGLTREELAAINQPTNQR